MPVAGFHLRAKTVPAVVALLGGRPGFFFVGAAVLFAFALAFAFPLALAFALAFDFGLPLGAGLGLG